MNITMHPIAHIHCQRNQAIDDNWGSENFEIVLADHIPEVALNGIEEFSHLEIIYFFHLVDEKDIVFCGRPRGNPKYPETGIFAQRRKDRPNRLGLTTVELLEHKGRVLKVRNLDAIDGTAVLDIKPVMREFQPAQVIRQPAWSSELMQNYWK